MPSRVLSPANEITILRLIFVPVFAILVVDGHDLAALMVLGVAALSDVADGFVARTFHQQTPLGVALDPIADKVLMTTAYLALAFRGWLPWWLTIVVISRDVAILLTAGVISLVAGYRPFPPSLFGKASTTTQVTTVFMALAVRVHLPIASPWLLSLLIDLTAALTVGSGLHYLFLARRRFGLASPPAPAAGNSADSHSSEVPEVKVRVKLK